MTKVSIEILSFYFVQLNDMFLLSNYKESGSC